MSKALASFTRYINETYAGQELLKKHSLEDEGIWEIRGEDPNCDFGGHHYQPDLGTVEGKLRDVIMYAVTLPSFWSWGGGGDFKSLGKNLPKIGAQSWVDREKLEAEQDRLEKELKAVKAKLKDMK